MSLSPRDVKPSSGMQGSEGAELGETTGDGVAGCTEGRP